MPTATNKDESTFNLDLAAEESQPKIRLADNSLDEPSAILEVHDSGSITLGKRPVKTQREAPV